MCRMSGALSAGFTPAQRTQCALLISGSPVGTSPELLQALAQQTVFTLAVDSGANVAFAAEVAVDLIVGDLDSVNPATRNFYHASKTPFLAAPAHKDETDLELALAELQRRGFNALVATNTQGGRLDHELASLGALSRAQSLNPIVIEDDMTAIFLSAGNFGRDNLSLSSLFCESESEDTLVSLLPLGGSAMVSTFGMKWELEGEILRQFDPRGISNIVCSQNASIKVESGTLLVIIPRVA